MSFGLDPGKLGFKLGDVLIGLQSGTTDTPEAIKSTEGRLHALQYLWNPETLAYEVVTPASAGAAVEYTVRLDEASATVTYVGKATAGSAEGSAVWRVSRLTSSGADLTIEYADGNTDFDNIWSNRAALSYS